MDPCQSYMAVSTNWPSFLGVSLQQEHFYLESILGRLFLMAVCWLAVRTFIFRGSMVFVLLGLQV